MGRDLYKAKNRWVKRSIKKHGPKFDYSKVDYVNSKTKVCIICPEHGEFHQTPESHVSSKHGCVVCGNENKKQNNYLHRENYIKRLILKHGYKYNYTETTYNGMHNCIRYYCPMHGVIEQTASNHLYHGCRYCKKPQMENDLSLLFENIKIKNINNHTFEWLTNTKTGGRLKLDFYLPDYNIGIECQGIQHFEPVKRFGDKGGLQIQQQRDKEKFDLCKENNVKLLYFTNVSKDKLPKEYLSKLYTNTEELLNEILNRERINNKFIINEVKATIT